MVNKLNIRSALKLYRDDFLPLAITYKKKITNILSLKFEHSPISLNRALTKDDKCTLKMARTI